MLTQATKSILTYGYGLLHGGYSSTTGWVGGKHGEGVFLTSLVLRIGELVSSAGYRVISVDSWARYGNGVINRDVLEGSIGRAPGKGEDRELIGVRV